jgi:LacI family transcriptional regulator
MRELAIRGLSQEHLALDPDRVQLGNWLKRLPKPVALFCCHDARAYQVLTLCKRLGIHVPAQAAVMGVDDDRILCGFASPMLSSIDPDAFRIGYTAAKTLSDMIANPRGKRDACVLIPPKALIPRASTQIYPVTPPWLSDALIFIGKNFTNGINADAVFRHVGRSHTGVEKAFRDVLETTVHKEILRVRVEAAARLLRTTGLAAAVIAERAGFSSPQHFSFAFRKACGLTPDTYRKRTQKKGAGKVSEIVI